MNTIDQESFSIVSFLPRESGVKCDTPSFQPYAVKREHDGEVFTVGDLVTNGTQMKGNILSFEMLNGHVFVNHSWSGVGINLGSLAKTVELPSRHQVGDKVLFGMQPSDDSWLCPTTGIITGVHFFRSKVKYDLELGNDQDKTRIYNVDSFYVQPYSEEEHRCFSVNK